MVDAPSDATVELASLFRPRLPAGTLAQFEPVSGILILNASGAELQAAASGFDTASGEFDADESGRQLLSAINHETYHYLQTIASGYQYLHMARLAQVVTREMGGAAKRSQRRRRSSRPLLALLGLGSRAGSRSAASLRGSLETLFSLQDMAQWQSQAQEGDYSLVGGMAPELPARVDEILSALWDAGPEGLSAGHVLEGSAIVYEHWLTRGRAGLEARLEAELEYHDEAYSKALELTVEVCGERALDILLPASAVALRYERPGCAFPSLVERLESSAPGSEISAARSLGVELPAIPGAGRRLGTALDVRKRERGPRRWLGTFRPPRLSSRHYDGPLEELGGGVWDCDEIDLLTTPEVTSRVPLFPLGMVLNDTEIGGQMDPGELGARMLMASLVLRTHSLPKKMRELEQRVIGRLGRSLGLYKPPSKEDGSPED